jgi:hypothetical protein
LASRTVPVSESERAELAGLADALSVSTRRIANLHTYIDARDNARTAVEQRHSLRSRA